MTNIEEIQNKLEGLYRAVQDEVLDQEVPLFVYVHPLTSYAKNYIDAAVIINRETPQNFNAITQLTGQAIELSLKACLAAANIEPPAEHDLVKICALVEENKFHLSDREKAAIVNLNNFYYRDLATQTKYKTRYPSRNLEENGGALEEVRTFENIFNSLIEQALQAISMTVQQPISEQEEN